jgi:hypothetical protein
MFESRLNAPWHVARRAAVALVCTLALSLSATAALADPPGRVGRVAETQGTVWMQDDVRGEWVAASRNRPLTSGDRLSLKPGARAVVHIGSGTLRLDGDTDLEVLALDDRVVRLHLHEGSVALQLPVTESAREFEITTSEGRVQTLQRSHYRVDRRDGRTAVTAWDGNLRFISRDANIDVYSGQRSEFAEDRGQTRVTQLSMGRDGFTEWVVASEREYGGYAAQQQYLSPEMTGSYDLHRHGYWETHPQYGPVWSPRRVSADWAPYRHGQWTWIAPWGWTWVDDEPWGFTPFHYGRWVQWNNRWSWTPGTYTARPVYAPALVAWFGGSNFSVSVSSGPHVGWVPLAPFEVFNPWYTASTVYVTAVNVSPWRTMRGYHDHHHTRGHGHGGGYHHGSYAHHDQRGFTAVPQQVLTDRRPVRPDVITPYQATVWRGGGAAAATVAPTVVPAPGRPGDGRGLERGERRDGQRGDDRIAAVPVFVPPPLAPRQATAVPAQAPGTQREIPWMRGGGVAARPSMAAPEGLPQGGLPQVTQPPVVQPQVVQQPSITQPRWERQPNIVQTQPAPQPFPQRQVIPQPQVERQPPQMVPQAPVMQPRVVQPQPQPMPQQLPQPQMQPRPAPQAERAPPRQGGMRQDDDDRSQRRGGNPVFR